MKLRELVPWRASGSKVPVRREDTPILGLQRDMNRLFDDFFSGFGLEPFFGGRNKGGQFSPSIDVDENDKEVHVRIEVPGMEEKDFELSLTDDHLTIRGEKKSEQERKEGGTTYFESSYGRFERILPLGVEIDSDNVDAKLNNGILTIKLPKAHPEKSKARKISISTN